jgi:orotidine-5'-phosphate decarboxylase
MDNNMKVFVALDKLSKNDIHSITDKLGTQVMFKINDAYTCYGPKIVEHIHAMGAEVFLDLKFFDIPNTMANYMKAVADLGVYMCNIHCLSGKQSMMRAVQELHDYCHMKGIRKPLLIGVTILTSMDDHSLTNDILMNKTDDKFIMNDMVIHLAKLAKDSGLDGVVCSPKEIKIVKETCGSDFITVTPGIRPVWAYLNDDQKRTMTPREAIECGTDYLVIGRPIVQANNYGLCMQDAVTKILDEIKVKE